MLDALADIPPRFGPQIVAGLATFALAVWLVVIDPASRTNRALACLLGLRATTLALGLTLALAPGTQAALGAFYALPYFLIGIVGSVVWFLGNYPTRRWVFRYQWGAPALLGIVLLLMGAYMANHGLYWVMTTRGPAWGPMGVFSALTYVSYAAAGYILARDYRRNPSGSRGYSLFLISAALLINAFVDAARYLVPFARTWYSQGASALPAAMFEGVPFFVTLVGLAALPLGIAGLYEMAKAMHFERSDATLQEARRLVHYGAPIAFATALGASIAREYDFDRFVHLVRGFWQFVLPAMITYSLLRFSLFDADIRMKATVRRGIMVGGLGLFFFVLMEAIEGMLNAETWLAGIASAGIISLVAWPLQNVATKAADALMPDTKAIAEMDHDERKEMFSDQVELVFEDRIVTERERKMLEMLAGKLGLSPQEILALKGDEFPALSSKPHAATP